MKAALTRIAREENLHTSSALVRPVLADFIQKRAGTGKEVQSSRC